MANSKNCFLQWRMPLQQAAAKVIEKTIKQSIKTKDKNLRQTTIKVRRKILKRYVSNASLTTTTTKN